jgi:hypothetical protein
MVIQAQPPDPQLRAMRRAHIFQLPRFDDPLHKVGAARAIV